MLGGAEAVVITGLILEFTLVNPLIPKKKIDDQKKVH